MEHALQDGKGGKRTSAKKKKVKCTSERQVQQIRRSSKAHQRRTKKILEQCRALGSSTTGFQMFIKEGNISKGDDVLQCMSNIIGNNFTKKKKSSL